jgi:hypothetical protein
MSILGACLCYCKPLGALNQAFSARGVLKAGRRVSVLLRDLILARLLAVNDYGRNH